MVIDSSAPRGSWMLGRVTETFPDKQGLVCVVCLKTKTGIIAIGHPVIVDIDMENGNVDDGIVYRGRGRKEGPVPVLLQTRDPEGRPAME